MMKKLTKKLLLNKETISKLQDNESEKIKAGIVTLPWDTCKCDTADSCSIVGNCCPTPPLEKMENG